MLRCSTDVAVLHIALHCHGDKYSANDLLDVQGRVGLFRGGDIVRVSKVDAFGLLANASRTLCVGARLG
ncbi:hypothetical protein C2845_PM01G46160 [Panicum miliaceum]|uniref:Uncharacterized protein n=1 Tax=Panicum miliaceum TaxID=4540 RepID=A0A3L6TKV8_PANMI|nr:hypothetical protein C2845_PM01G46160 [Panicum miliaceum]